MEIGTRRALWLAPLVAAAGIFSGRLLAGARATTRFDVGDWPARGRGERLVEYFDPTCSASRALHRRLQELLGPDPRVRHVLVPVAISRSRTGAAPADLLCAMAPGEAWDAARRWADSGPDISAAERLSPTRIQRCGASVETATRRTGTLEHTRWPSVPMVELGGKVYAGLGDLPALEQALRGNP